MDYIVIILGRLEYVNVCSVQQVIKVIVYFLEIRYKNEVFYWDVIEFFDEELCMFIVLREKFQCFEKVWSNIIYLLVKVIEFFIVGDLYMWKILDGML